MPIVSTGLVNQAEITRRVRVGERKMAREVVYIRHSIMLNSTGEWSISSVSY